MPLTTPITSDGVRLHHATDRSRLNLPATSKSPIDTKPIRPGIILTLNVSGHCRARKLGSDATDEGLAMVMIMVMIMGENCHNATSLWL